MPIAVVKERAEAREIAEAEKDAPLRADIRLLGRLLGDTVREQEGAEVYAIVERIRQASIRFHRDNEVGARRELAATLDSLDNDQTLTHRARLQLFLASGQYRRGPAPHPPQPRPCADADRSRGRARWPTPSSAPRDAGVDAHALRAFFDHALVSPVLTAHPTEVRRKSTLTRELEIAALLDARQRHGGDEVELARAEEQLRRAVFILWRTNMLRQTRLKVSAKPPKQTDAPLRADIRLLGRLLGDTVREQEGAEVYAIVERIRQASIRFHRDNEVARGASWRRRSTASTTTRR